MTSRKTIIAPKLWRVFLIICILINAASAARDITISSHWTGASLLVVFFLSGLLVVHNGTIHRLVAQRNQEELRIWRREHSPDYEAIDALDMELSGQTFYHSKAPDYLPEEEFLANEAAGKEAEVAAHAEIQKQTEASTEEAMRTPDQRVIASQPCGCYQMATGFVSMCDIHAARNSRKNTHRLVSGELATLSKALRESPPECGCTNYGPDQVFLCDKHAGLTRQLADELHDFWGLSKSGAIKSAQTEVARQLADEARLAENRRKLHAAQVADLTGQQESWDQLMADQHPEQYALSQQGQLSPEPCGCKTKPDQTAELCTTHAEKAARIAHTAITVQQGRRLTPEQQEIWDQLAALREREHKLGSW